MSLQPFGEINCNEFEFEWKVKIDQNFLSKVNGQCVSSDTFITYSFGKEIKWCLDLYPNGYSEESRHHIAILLKNLSKFTVDIGYDSFLLNSNNVKVKESTNLKKTFEPDESAGYFKFVERGTFMNPQSFLEKDNQITILCIITVNSIVSVQEQEYFNRVNEFDDFEKLLLSEKFSDLTIISADEKKLYVHKSILASRSPVFEAMFEHNMTEKIENIVKIEDIDYEVLLEMFRFIYSAKVTKLDLLICELLKAADKYSISGLKLLCEEALSNNLTMDNAVTKLIAAKQSSSKKFKRIIDFILKNAQSIVKTPEFKSVGILHPDLMYEILFSLVYKS